MKPQHVKPQFYSLCFDELHSIARDFGYNLVLHGSLNRDMDLIAIPWVNDPADSLKMIEAFCDYLGGEIMTDHPTYGNLLPGGRKSYVINLNRGGYSKDLESFKEDPFYYLDISVTPIVK